MKLRTLFLSITLLTSLLIRAEDANVNEADKTVYTMTTNDYQSIVDYVNTNFTNTHSHPENSENRFGTSAYYSNFDARNGNYDDSFANSDSAIAEGLATAFLPVKYPNALVNDTFQINFTKYTGVASYQSMTFVCADLVPLTFDNIATSEVIIPTTDFGDLSFGTDSTFDVITWNVEHFPKSDDITMAKVREVVSMLEPEVVAFQEIDDTAHFREMIDELEGYEPIIGDYSYAPMCFIYKVDSVSVNNIQQLFADDDSSFPREPLVLDCSFRGEDFIVVSNHLKCCGDGVLDESNSSDEENRRLEAIKSLKNYIDIHWEDRNVIVVGDFNDVLEDEVENNVFMPFLNDADNYLFADINISYGSSEDFSYPSWPSHLDHILITDELFERSNAQVIKVDENIGWSAYDADISDHRPVGLQVLMSQGVSSSIAYVEPLVNTISLRPNPVYNELTIDGLSAQENTNITLYDNKGQKLQHLTSTGLVDLSLDLSEYSSGIYVLSVQADSQYLSAKVMKL